jgi:hypothetical protein
VERFESFITELSAECIDLLEVGVFAERGGIEGGSLGRLVGNQLHACKSSGLAGIRAKDATVDLCQLLRLIRGSGLLCNERRGKEKKSA